MSATVTAIRQHPEIESARQLQRERETEYLLDAMREADNLVRLEFAEAVGKSMAHERGVVAADALVQAYVQHRDAKTPMERVLAKSRIAAAALKLCDGVLTTWGDE